MTDDNYTATGVPSQTDAPLEEGQSFPDFPYIDVAFGGASNRNCVIKSSELNAFAHEWRQRNRIFDDCFRTYFRFPMQFQKHFETNGTVRGYNGPCYADYLPFDIDSADLTEAHESLKALLRHLHNKYSLGFKTLRIYFSGAKGFHIELPADLFNFEPSPDLHKIFKELALNLIPEGAVIDTAIYDKMRLWRLPNTINSNSDLYKIPLLFREIFKLTIDEIKELARKPRREVFNDPNVKLNPELHALYQTALKDISTSRKTPIDGAKKYHNIFNGPIKEGERNSTLTSLAGLLKSKGVGIGEARVILYAVNATLCTPPLEEPEVEGIVDSAYSYENTDEIKFSPVRVKD
ncbi:MAG: primase C-terminal domain-containing protein, partial [Thermodesulfobacteriota bacterium]